MPSYDKPTCPQPTKHYLIKKKYSGVKDDGALVKRRDMGYQQGRRKEIVLPARENRLQRRESGMVLAFAEGLRLHH